MANTTKLLLELMDSNQSQKYITHNDNMKFLDILTQASCINRTTATPPGSPSDGDTYIIATSPTGAWSGKDLNVTAYLDGVWRFFPPHVGWVFWVAAENALKVWNGTSWTDYNAVSGFIRTPAATSLTIASGIVTATQTTHKIEVSSGTTDNLITINGGAEGYLLMIEQVNAAHTIVVKHATGNIRNFAGADVSLSAYGKAWFGRHDGTNWIQYGV